MQDRDKPEWRKEHGIEKYAIDRRLKQGKDYPPDLLRLFAWLNDPRPMLAIRKPMSKRRLEEMHNALSPEEMEKVPKNERKAYVAKIEKQFDTGVDGAAVHQFKKEISSVERTFQDFFLNPSREIQDRCIKEVNAKLWYVHPVVSRSAQAFSLGFEVRMSDLRSKRKDLGLAHIYWVRLARAMVGLDPRLVHQCPYCKGIFVSRQRKRFHPPCRSQFFSEKYVQEGLAAKHQKEYRERHKQKR